MALLGGVWRMYTGAPAKPRTSGVDLISMCCSKNGTSFTSRPFLRQSKRDLEIVEVEQTNRTPIPIDSLGTADYPWPTKIAAIKSFRMQGLSVEAFWFLTFSDVVHLLCKT
jgi:hypothetical protein